MKFTPGPFMRFLARRMDPGSPTGIYLSAGLGCAAVTLLGFLSIAEDVMESATFAIDRWVWAWSVAVRTPVLTRVFWVATLAGDTRVMFVSTTLAALALIAWGKWRGALVVVLLVVVGSRLDGVLKGLFDRPRPPAHLALIAQPASASFPSGHALSSLMLFGTLALLLLFSARTRPLPVAGALACVLAFLTIATSRVYLGVHYTSDVIASWLLGATLMALAVAALLAWERFRPPKGASELAGLWLRIGRWALVLIAPFAVVAALVMEAGANPLLR